MHHTNESDSVIAQAQQQVAARRITKAWRRWHGPWRWLLPLLAVFVLGVFMIAPGTLVEKMMLAMSGICGLRPAHSYFLGGVQLPLEARYTGIYIGFLVTFAATSSRLGARQLGSRPINIVLALFFASMVVDGVNSTIATVGLRSLYQSNNVTRLLTGMLSGIATGAFFVWLLGIVAVLPHTEDTDRAIIRSLRDLLIPLACCSVATAVVLSGAGVAYYPIALLSIIGAVSVLGVTALLLVLRTSGLAGNITTISQLATPTALATLVVFALLAVSAAYRFMNTGNPLFMP